MYNMYNKQVEGFNKLIEQAGKEWKESIAKLRIKLDTEYGIIF